MQAPGFSYYALRSPNQLALATPDGRHWSRGELLEECRRLAGAPTARDKAGADNPADDATRLTRALAFESRVSGSVADLPSAALADYGKKMRALPISTGDHNVLYCVAPVDGGDKLTWALAALHHGHALVVAGEWRPQHMLRAMERYRVTTAFLDEHQAKDLLRMEEEARGACDTSSLRYLIVDTSGTSTALRRKLAARFDLTLPG
jgi:hypothetical protein